MTKSKHKEMFWEGKKTVRENEKLRVLGMVENLGGGGEGGEGENAGYQHFLLFPLCFQQAFFFEVVKSRD